jgi:chromosome segregation ATPase
MAFFLSRARLVRFKSFEGPVDVDFAGNGALNLLAGANGHGKSNLVDAIAFALTVPRQGSTQRAAALQDLVYNKALPPPGSGGIAASVELRFEPEPEEEPKKRQRQKQKAAVALTITAQIVRKGATARRASAGDSDADPLAVIYRIGGRVATQKSVRAALLALGIDATAPGSFLVQQNTVTAVALSPPKELEKLLSAAVGTRPALDLAIQCEARAARWESEHAELALGIARLRSEHSAQTASRGTQDKILALEVSFFSLLLVPSLQICRQKTQSKSEYAHRAPPIFKGMSPVSR